MPTDPLVLSDDRRHQVPVTLLIGRDRPRRSSAACSPSGAPWADEFDAIDDAEVVKLGTGHWPQFSQPDALAQAILAGGRR